MRRFWIGLGILGLFLLSGFWISSRMQAIHIPISEKLAQASEAAHGGHWDQAKALEDEASDRWERYRNFSAACCNHQPMDEIDARLRQLEVYRRQGLTARYSAECVYLAERMEDLAESFRLSWWNLL